MPEKTKKEHYVPRVYLRRFCKNPEKLNVYDKANNEIRLNQHIMDIASERYFYDIDFNAFADRIDANDEIWQAAKGLDRKGIVIQRKTNEEQVSVSFQKIVTFPTF